MIPYSRQLISYKDIKNVKNVLLSNFLTTGPEIKKFEKKIKFFCNSKYATVVSSASAGLHIACIALGLKKNDIVWTSPITFVSTASAALHCGAKIDFVDIDPKTFNLCVNSLKDKLIKAKKNRKLPKIVIPVHLAGNPCEMKLIKQLSIKYKFKVLEDASHAIGSKIGVNKIGNSRYSDATVFSFHPVKIITTGEGGAILTNNSKIQIQLKRLREHGIERNIKTIKNKKKFPWYYEQQELGFNYRLSDIQASLGSSQMSQIKRFLNERNRQAKYYLKKLDLSKLGVQAVDSKNYSSYHLFITLFPKNLRLKIFNELRKKKYYVNVHYIPVFYHPMFKRKFNLKQFPNAINYYERAISLPLYPGLKLQEIDKVIKIINKFI